jgi:hypothetical protein
VDIGEILWCLPPTWHWTLATGQNAKTLHMPELLTDCELFRNVYKYILWRLIRTSSSFKTSIIFSVAFWSFKRAPFCSCCLCPSLSYDLCVCESSDYLLWGRKRPQMPHMCIRAQILTVRWLHCGCARAWSLFLASYPPVFRLHLLTTSVNTSCALLLCFLLDRSSQAVSKFC